jgi:hypothetical protein
MFKFLKSLFKIPEMIFTEILPEPNPEEKLLIEKIDEWMKTHNSIAISIMPFVNESCEIRDLMYDLSVNPSLILKLLSDRYRAYPIEEDTYTRYYIEKKVQ